MQEEEAREHGLRLHYQLIDLDGVPDAAHELPALLQAARLMGFCGLNITFPFKQAVVPLLDELSDEARAIGAVNTVVFREGRSIGHNTDCSGWRWGFENSLPNADLADVVLLGAGGAGSAIAHALMGMKMLRLTLYDKDATRAAALTAQLARIHGKHRVVTVDDSELLAAALSAATGLVNATPVGMNGLPGLPLPSQLLRPGLWVADAVYFPLETDLLKQARAHGCATVDGGTMAVGQAVGAFEHFTGRTAEAGRMKAHFARLLAHRHDSQVT
jgi:shikimate dehydrogenase